MTTGGTPSIFSQAVTLIEYEQSGNPREKYKAGSGFLKLFLGQAVATGDYIPYMDRVIFETQNRYDELETEIQRYANATFTVSLEHRDPEAYRRMRLLEAMEEEHEMN